MSDRPRRQTVLRTIRHEKTDRVPFHLVMDPTVKTMLEDEGVDVEARLARNYIDWLSLRDPHRQDLSETAFIDQFGVHWESAGRGWPARASGRSETVSPERSVLPDPHDPRQFESLEARA